MKRLSGLLLLAALVAMVATACSGSPDTAAPGEQTERIISIEDFDFGAPIEISVGDTVVVTNEDAVPHTWTSDDGVFDSGVIDPGESYRFSFDAPGEYPFFCELHPSMIGSITVTS